MKGIKAYNSLEEMEIKNNQNYVGYYWMSDKQSPNRFDANSFKNLKSNPFIIEGMLWDEINQTSIMIKHTGRYIINEFNLNEIKTNQGVKIEEKEYIPFRLKEVGAKDKVYFNQIWLPEKDPLCENMEVLKLKAIIFTGF